MYVWGEFFCIFYVFDNEDFLCALFFDFWCFYFIFLCTFFAFFASAERRSRFIRHRCDNIGDNQHGESYFIGNKQYSSKNLSYCPIHRFLESIRSLTADDLLFFDIKKRRWHLRLKHGAPLEKVFVPE